MRIDAEISARTSPSESALAHDGDERSFAMQPASETGRRASSNDAEAAKHAVQALAQASKDHPPSPTHHAGPYTLYPRWPCTTHSSAQAVHTVRPRDTPSPPSARI
ncbi:hypothetical protein GY45DRAFT_1367439 [Cubamyces sp. BRFM 1775]|nr:hypothetical protein GY45DRAFT_1367439 [Cubamyces sp. BRFM 1775]